MKRCPICGADALEKIDEVDTDNFCDSCGAGYVVIYECENCHAEVHAIVKE